MLIDAIDRLEADKIALRGDPTAKRERPKRSTKPGRGRPGLTTRRDIRPPSRLQRVEVAAITLASLLSTHDGDSEIGRALRALEEALSNKKGFER